MSGEIDIALGFDANYAPHAGVVIASIVRNAPGARFRFICLHDGIDEGLRTQVEACAPGMRFHWAEIGEDDLPAFETRGHFNRAILFRIGLETHAPCDCKRVIYIDSDTIVCGDVREIWNSDLGEYSVGAVQDCYQDGREFAERWGMAGEPVYFNSGVMLIDLSRVRRHREFQMAAAFVARHANDILFGDQDALNFAFWRNWAKLDPAWNVQKYMAGDEIARAGWKRTTPGLVHFIGMQKPWMANVWHPWAWLYWEVARTTPFADKIAADNKIDLYQIMRLKLRWLLKRPGAGRAR